MAEKYHGKPCGVCGGTERYRAGRNCVRRYNKDHMEAHGTWERRRLQLYFAHVNENIKHKRERVEAAADRLGVTPPWQTS
jgi:hypothetical protein